MHFPDTHFSIDSYVGHLGDHYAELPFSLLTISLQSVCVFLLFVYRYFYMLGYEDFVRHIYCGYLSGGMACLFTVIMKSSRTDALNLNEVHFINILFIIVFAYHKDMKVEFCFSSRDIIISPFSFRAIIHLKLILLFISFEVRVQVFFFFYHMHNKLFWNYLLNCNSAFVIGLVTLYVCMFSVLLFCLWYI